MHAKTVPVVILLLATALNGCGQKGPLYRENPEASSGLAKSVASESAHTRHRDTNQDSNGLFQL